MSSGESPSSAASAPEWEGDDAKMLVELWERQEAVDYGAFWRGHKVHWRWLLPTAPASMYVDMKETPTRPGRRHGVRLLVKDGTISWRDGELVGRNFILWADCHDPADRFDIIPKGRAVPRVWVCNIVLNERSGYPEDYSGNHGMLVQVGDEQITISGQDRDGEGAFDDITATIRWEGDAIEAKMLAAAERRRAAARARAAARTAGEK
jgi:hypothetical protein